MSSIATMIISAVAIVSFTGCGSSTDILESVPADAAVVITLSPESLDRDLDGTAHGGKMTAPEILSTYLQHSHPDIRTAVKSLLSTKAIDRKRLAIYSHHDTNGVDLLSMLRNSVYIVTFIINDEQILADELGADSPDNINGFTVYNLHESSLVAKGRQVWLISGKPKKAVETISRQLDIAEGQSIADIKEGAEFLRKEGYLFNMLISCRETGTPGWSHICAKLDEDGHALKLESSFYDLNGKLVDLDANLEKINSKILKYIAPSDVFVIGLGLSEDTDWDSVTEYFTTLYPLSFSQRAVVAMVVQYLRRIDGTVLIAAGPTSVQDIDSPEALASQISFFMGIELKKNQVKPTLSELNNLITTLGLPARRLDNDTYIMEFPGFAPVTLQVINGNCIALTNRPLEQTGNKSATNALKGSSFAVWANIPDQLAGNTYGGPGFKLTAGIKNTFEASFKFNDTETPILEQFATMMFRDTTVHPEMSDDMNYGFTPIDTIR